MRSSLLILCFALRVLARQCYYPGHNPSQDVPCSNDESEHTHCCGMGDLCVSNGYCYNVAHEPYLLSRASCTDQTWKSPNCPQRCTSDNDSPKGGCSIINLNYTNDQANYCCGTPVWDSNSNAITCPNGEQPFGLNPMNIMPGVTVLSDLVSKSSCSSDNSTCNNSSKNAAIGAGVGVPLGVIALTALAWGFWERSQRAKQASGFAQPIYHMPSQGYIPQQNAYAQPTYSQTPTAYSAEQPAQRGYAAELSPDRQIPELAGHK